MRLFLFALLFITSPAFSASFNLENDETLLYAQEALNADDLNSSGQLIINSASDDLNITFRAGFGVSASRKYIRIDLVNGVFNNTFPVTGVANDAAYTTTLILGGGEGDSFIIVEVSAVTPTGPDIEFTLETDSFIFENNSESLDVQYTLYDKASAAIYDGVFIYRSSAVMAKVVNAIGNSYTRSFTHSVGFNQDFLRFNPTFRSPSVFSLGDATEDLASLGKVQFDKIMLDDVRLASTSVVISNFADLFPNFDTAAATANIQGDFSSITMFLNKLDDCSGDSVALVEYSSEKNISTSIDNLITYPVLCVSAESEDVSINRSSYQLDLGIGIDSSLIGELVYDAASIDLPYITNFEEYRQQIILVNHAGYDVAYSSRFVAEEDVGDNFVLGTAAEGIIPANSTLQFTTEDLVTIDSGVPSRLSARIFIDAKPSDISAAIQILSLGSDTPPQTNVLQVLAR
jgi:hypothetical protein